MCYTTASLVNWIIKLMLKYYGSVFLFCIHEEILLHQWLSPQEPPQFTQCSTLEPENITKQRKWKPVEEKENSKFRHHWHNCKIEVLKSDK